MGKLKFDNPLVKTIPWPPPPFPKRLKKKKQIGKFKNFIPMLKKLSMNIPLLEVLKKMSEYSKFMKAFVTKKRVVNCEDAGGLNYYNTITLWCRAQK